MTGIAASMMMRLRTEMLVMRRWGDRTMSCYGLAKKGPGPPAPGTADGKEPKMVKIVGKSGISP
jgi:hypothetical protein